MTTKPENQQIQQGATAPSRGFKEQSHANYTPTRGGKAAAICICCNRKSRPVEVCKDGEPDLWMMPKGWTQSPFPADFRHRDGSIGSIYTCPACNKLLRRGEALKLRNGGAGPVVSELLDRGELAAYKAQAKGEGV